jgi:hypothetical protein
MTSIEWLIDKLGISEITHKKLFEKAKEMHKEDMSDSYKDGWMSCEKWFEDKELDDHIVETNEMVELPQQEISDEEIALQAYKYEQYEFYGAGTAFEQGAKWYREQLKERQHGETN